MTTSVFQRYEQRELDEINRAFITIDLESENEIAECLQNAQTAAEEKSAKERQLAREEHREEEIMIAIANCDTEVLDDLSEDEENRFGERAQPCLEARKLVVEQAVVICNFAFFENQMTQKERNDWFSERKKCEENPPQQVLDPVEAVSVSAPVPKLSAVDPVVIPTYAPTVPSESTTLQPGPVEVEELVEEDVLTTSGVTGTPEKIEITEDELDQLVEERLRQERKNTEAVEESVLEEKPSFFRRVTNFLFGWIR